MYNNTFEALFLTSKCTQSGFLWTQTVAPHRGFCMAAQSSYMFGRQIFGGLMFGGLMFGRPIYTWANVRYVRQYPVGKYPVGLCLIDQYPVG